MTIALTAISLTLVVVSVVLVLSERRQTLREKEWALERGALLQRIQAPEVAVYENAREERKAPLKVGFEDDRAFAAAKRVRDGDGD